MAAGYSYFFAIQKGDFPAELAKSGVRHQSYLPTAAAPGVCCPQVLAMKDPTVGIQWPVGAPPLLAAKDAAALTLDQAELFA